MFVLHPNRKNLSVSLDIIDPVNGQLNKKHIVHGEVLIGKQYEDPFFIREGYLMEVVEDTENVGYVKIPIIREAPREIPRTIISTQGTRSSNVMPDSDRLLQEALADEEDDDNFVKSSKKSK